MIHGLKLLSIVLLTVSFVKCGDSIPESVSLEAYSTEVRGLQEESLLAVSDDSYILNARQRGKDTDTWALTTRVKLKKLPGKLSKRNNGTANMILLDEQGEIIKGAVLSMGEGSLDTKTSNEFNSLLKNQKEEQLVVCFHLLTTNKEKVLEIMHRSRFFMISFTSD